MWLVAVVIVPLVAALGAGFIGRIPRSARPGVLFLPAFLAWIGLLVCGISAFQGNLPTAFSLAWFPQLEVNLDFNLTGLGWLLGLLITGIGSLILLYAGGYMGGAKQEARLYAYLYLFMFAMLGLAFSDNLILTFVFWELTSVVSYLLISFKHEYAEARRNALQGLLITGLGGMALMAGFILLASATGTWRISELALLGDQVVQHPHYIGILTLVLLGAFTKSAQFPFHVWLPNAMSAPTPVSAYLHSATMVKAGVFLLALFTPILGQTPAWTWTLSLVGGITFLHGCILGLLHQDLKKILAGTTIAVLGMLVFLLGLGTDKAFHAAILLLLAHAFYKASLFMMAGNVDQATGTRDLRRLQGLRRLMPWTALTAGLAAFSKMGLPPFWGFIGKEYAYKAGLDTAVPIWGTGTLLLGSLLLFAIAVKVAIIPFWTKPAATSAESKVSEVKLTMRWPPLTLAMLGLLTGLAPSFLQFPVDKAVATITNAPFEASIYLWQGFNLPLLLSGLTVLGGLAFFGLTRSPLLNRLAFKPLADSIYDICLKGVLDTAKHTTKTLQSGYLRNYLLIILASTFVLVFYKLYRFGGWPSLDWSGAGQPLILGVLLLMVIAIWSATTAHSRLVALISLGSLGYGVALIFAFFGAPDLAITQILVETLTVVLFAWVIAKLPDYHPLSSQRSRWIDAGISLTAGAMLTVLVLKAQIIELGPRISELMVDWSLPQAFGANVVNVILVDFRALDTFGEVIVIAIAALGVWALLTRPYQPKPKPASNPNPSKKES